MVGSLVTCAFVLSCDPGLAHADDPASNLEGMGLPPNLSAASVFQPDLERMVRMSPTFRSQCQRLAAAPSVKVQLRLEDPQRRPSFRARTVVERDQGIVVAAHIFLYPSADAVELIAHEIEHVLEQLDGVDLEAQVGSGNVWKREDGAFETRRATEAGLRVPREMRERSKASTNSRWLMTVVQQDRFSGPSERPSARVSARGRHVVFSSYARLVVADANQMRDIYVLDLSTGHVTLESAGRDGSAANGDSGSPDISGDGRYIVFASVAGNLGETQIAAGVPRVFLRDRETSTTRLLTTSARGGPANGYSTNPAISADGTTVVFESAATDLLPSDAPNDVSVYMMRPSSNERARLSVSDASAPRAGQSVSPSISANGRYIAFMSKADLTCRDTPACVREPPDRNGVADVYVRDAVTNTTTRVSRSYAGKDPNGASYDPAISGDGRYVVFVSEASNLTRESGRHGPQVYSRDIVNGVTELVSRNPSGQRANGPSVHPAVSHDGSTVAFQSLASDLLCIDHCDAAQRDINLLWDVFVHERHTRTVRASADDDDEEWMETSRAPSLDGTGRVLAFGSRHPISGRADSHDENLFVWVRTSTPPAGPSSRRRNSRHSVEDGDGQDGHRPARVAAR